jgi:hypothetical protein
MVIFFAEAVTNALEEDEDIEASGAGREHYIHNPC